MGAYLTVPITGKVSSNEAIDSIDVGASSMQGWRISQEDAHNCILNFDENTSFFAVYDGHGGAEVATYCAEKLPAFLKELQTYKDGDFEQALKDAFLGFDKTLLDDEIIGILKRLAGEKNPDKDSDNADEEEEEDLMELCQEGTLPLEKVLEKYKGCAAAAKFPQINKLKQDEAGASGSGTSKPLSPFLRGRRNPNNSEGEPSKVSEDAGGGPSCSSTSPTPAEESSMPDLDADDSIVSSSCGKNEKKPATSELDTKVDDVADKSNEASCSNGTVTICSSPDSSSTKAKATAEVVPPVVSKTKVQNGDISSYQDAAGKSENVSSSSSLAASASKQENGEVSSNSKADQSPEKSSPSRSAAGLPASSGISSSTVAAAAIARPKAKPSAALDMDDSSSDDDADFQAEEDNSSTEDGEEDCEAGDDDDTEDDENDEEDEETEDEEEGLMDDDDTAFCTNMIEEPGKDSGCTAVVALLNGRDLYVANAGDSRCVVCRNGKAIEMSFDHKPEDDEESERIYKAGGKVTLDGRVNGGLNLSRAIGDHAYKMNQDLPAEKQMISALPDVQKLIISPNDEFMILACDGIWNFMSSDEVVEFIKKRIDEGCEKLSQICEQLFNNCLAPNTMGDGTGCDNMTAVIIRFKPAILDLPTKISMESEAVPIAPSRKRAASPARVVTDDGTAAAAAADSESSSTNESASKRMKIDDDVKPVSAQDDDDVAMSSTTSDNQSTTSSTTT